MTHSEEAEFSKLDALFKDIDRWEELFWKQLSNEPLTEEETREYAELDAATDGDVHDDFADIFEG